MYPTFYKKISIGTSDRLVIEIASAVPVHFIHFQDLSRNTNWNALADWASCKGCRFARSRPGLTLDECNGYAVESVCEGAKNRILSCSRKPTPQRSSKACFHEQPARSTWKYHLSLELGLANGITAIQDRLDTALAEGPEGCESERCANRIKQDLRQSDLRIPRCWIALGFSNP